MGAGAHSLVGPRLAACRDAVADPATGDYLLATVAAIEQAGHTVDGETLSRLPRGFTADGEQARLLRHKALHASVELPATRATDLGLVSTLMGHWRNLAPLHSWLVAYVD